MYCAGRILLFLCSVAGFQSLCFAQPAAPFSRGVNLTNWFQSDVERLDFGRYDRTDLENIKSLGADVIRLPVDLKAMLKADHSPDERFLFFLDIVARQADSVGIQLILDNHTFDPAVDTRADAIDWLLPAWQKLAHHYLGRFPGLHFEILNEPHGISDAVWNSMQLQVVAAIRAIDATRWLVVGGAGWNSIWNLNPMPVYPFEKLIFTFHFYEPFLFTHQGASWTSPSLVNLRNVPFPYNSGTIPNAPSDLVGTWVVGALRDYANSGTAQLIENQLEIAAKFSRERNVPVFCGEFGVYIPNSPAADRKHWYKVVSQKLNSKGISWTTWDYHGGFGLFRKDYPAAFEHDFDVALADSIGFSAPSQTVFERKPEMNSITIYSDFSAKGLFSQVWSPGGYSSLLHRTRSDTMDFQVAMARAPQYSAVAFRFSSPRDFSLLRAGRTTVDFKIRGTSGISKLDLRFLDSKTGETDRPWRMRRVLEAPQVRFDGVWHSVSIPLEGFQDAGAWDDNRWFDPQGTFDWKEVERLEFVAEHHALLNDSLFVDDVRITYTSLTAAEETIAQPEIQISVYPNPFNPQTTLSIDLPQASAVTVSVVDVLGRITSVHRLPILGSGKHAISLDGSGWSSGIYLVRVEAGGKVFSRKITLLK